MAVNYAQRQASRLSLLGTSPIVKLFALVLLATTLHLAREILIPIALAVFLSFILVYPVSLLERWRLGRVGSVCVAGLLAFVLLGFMGWLVVKQMNDLIAELPKHSLEIEAKLSKLGSTIRLSGSEMKEVIDKLATAIEPKQEVPAEGAGGHSRPAQSGEASKEKKAESSPFSLSSPVRPIFVSVVETPTGTVSQALAILSPFVSPLSKSGMIVFFVIFMLMGRENLRNRLLHVISRGHLHGATQTIHEAVGRVGRYLLMGSMINGGSGAAAGLGLLLLGSQGWALWGVLYAAFRFLPYIGPWLGSLPPIVILMATSDGWWAPLAAVGLFVGLECLIGFFLEPWLLGASAGVSAFAILLSAVFWTWLWGPIGMILATPLTVCLVVIGKYFPRFGYLNVLLGDGEPLSPAEKYYQRLLAEDPREAASLIKEARRHSTEVEVCDDILAPVLQFAGNDALAGDLSEETLAEICDHVKKMAEIAGDVAPEDGESPAAVTLSKDTTGEAAPASPCVLCIPTLDDVDVVGASMLSRFLLSEGCHTREMSRELLVGELIDLVEAVEARAVCIVALAASSHRHANAFVKRLRARLPGITLVVWQSNADSAASSAADDVTTSARDTIAALHRLGVCPATSGSESPLRAASVPG